MRTPFGVVIATVVLASTGGGVASAAKPAKGARFYGLQLKSQKHVKRDAPADTVANLKVSRSGRRFSRGRLSTGCGTVHFRRVRIRRGGRFFLRRGGFRLRGRFVSPGYGRIVYRARVPRRRHRRGVCRKKDAVALYRNGKPPYSGCRRQRAKTLFRSSVARVFRQYVGDSASFSSHLFACSFDTNKRFDLGQERNESDPDFTDVIALGGAFVAIQAGGCPPAGGACTSSVDILDVRTGVRADLDTSTLFGYSSVTDLELRDNGSVAFIARRVYDQFSQPGPPGLEVWVRDRHGRRMLDSGTKIKDDSLTLSGSTISWVNNGVTKTATID